MILPQMQKNVPHCHLSRILKVALDPDCHEMILLQILSELKFNFRENNTLFFMFHCPTWGRQSFSLPVSLYFSCKTKQRCRYKFITNYSRVGADCQMANDKTYSNNIKHQFIYPRGRQNACFNWGKFIVNFDTKLLRIRVLMIRIVMNRLKRR